MSDDPMQQLFESLDQDGDGVLNRDDLTRVMGDMPPAKLDEIFAQLSRDGSTITLEGFVSGFDMFISNTEFKEELEADDDEDASSAGGLSSATPEQIKSLFDSLDTDQDGKITVNDLLRFMPSTSADQLEHIVNSLDEDGTGFVTWDNFEHKFEAIAHIKNEAEEKAPSKATRRKSLLHSKVKFTDLLDKLNEDASLVATDSENDTEDSDAHLDERDDHLSSKEQIELFQNRIRMLRQRCRHTRRRYKLLARKGGDIEEENFAMNAELSTLKHNLRYSRDEMKEMQESIVSYRKMIKNLQTREITLKQDLSSIEALEKDALMKLEREEAEKKEIERSLSVVKEELESIKHNKSANNRLRLKQSKLGELGNRLSSQDKRKIAEQKKRIAELTEMKERDDETIMILEERIQSLLRRIEELEARLAAYSGGRASLADQWEDEDAAEDEPNKPSLPDSILEEPDEEEDPDIEADDEDEPQKPRRRPRKHAVDDSESGLKKQRNQQAQKLLNRLHGTVNLSSSHESLERLARGRKRATGVHKRSTTLGPQKLHSSGAHKIIQKKVENLKKISEGKAPESNVDTLKQLQEDRKKIHELETRNHELEKQIAELRALQQAEKEAREKQADQMLKRIHDIILTPEAQKEVTAYAKYFNYCLRNSPHVRQRLPINTETGDLLVQIKDGWLIAEFLNFTVENTIDVRALNNPTDGDLSDQQVLENLTLVLESCKGLGIEIGAIAANHIHEAHKDPLMVIDFLWRVIKNQLLLKVTPKRHPELTRLCEDSTAMPKEPDDLLRMTPEAILESWFNYHVKHALRDAEVNEILSKTGRGMCFLEGSYDHPHVHDAKMHTCLLRRLAPAFCSNQDVQVIASQNDNVSKASYMLKVAEKLGLVPACMFVTPSILTEGGPVSERLTMAFTANLFNIKTGIDALSDEEAKEAGFLEDDAGDDRQERAFRLWINSMKIPDAGGHLYINNLFGECKDGIVLLRVIDHIKPGTVNWKKVEMKPTNKFKRVANCNYVVELCRSHLHMALVAVGGIDLTEGNKKLTLSIVWQLMHHHIGAFLSDLFKTKFNKPQSATANRRSSFFSPEQKDNDKMLLDWAITRVKNLSDEQKQLADTSLRGTNYELPFSIPTGFKDSSISTSLFFLHLLWAIEPRYVKWNIVTAGKTPQDKLMNARYCVSVARKLGATIFLLPEDIVEVNHKLLTSFLGGVLAIDHIKKVGSELKVEVSNKAAR